MVTQKQAQPTQALAIKKPADPMEQLAKYQEQQCNVLMPICVVDGVPPGTCISIRPKLISSNPNDGQVYKTKRGGLALHGRTLDEIAGLAGMTQISAHRTDDRKHPHYCEFEVRYKVTDFDGTVREVVGTKTLDFRVDAGGGEPGKDYAAIDQIKNPGELAQQRSAITELCVSKAKNRAIRTLLAIKQSYTAAELAKPFIVPKLIVDTSDPQARAMVMANIMGATQALYGQPQQQALPSGQVIDMAPNGNGTYHPTGAETDMGDGADVPPASPPTQPAPSTSSGMAERIAGIKNVYELNNWAKKHYTEIEALPHEERAHVYSLLDAKDAQIKKPATAEEQQPNFDTKQPPPDAFTEVYKKAHSVGYSAEQFAELCKATCGGRYKKSELTLENLTQIAEVVLNKYLADQAAREGGAK
jgi:hypothetical protein